MASSMVFEVACFTVMVCMVWCVPVTHGSVTCIMVETKLAPCVAYVMGSGGAVPQACCNGIKSLNNQANNKSDRQAVCKCIKSAAKNIHGINFDTLADLPKQCGVNLPYNLSPSIDCDKYV